MKKIISLGIASAVLAMTALSASAGVVVTAASEANDKNEVTFAFVIDTELPAMGGIEFTLKATGAELVAGTPAFANGVTGFINEKTGFAAGFAGTTAVSAGTTILTATYTITAKAGEQVTITVEGVGGDLADKTVTPGIFIVDDGTTSDPSTSDPSTSDPSTSDPSTSDPSTSDPSTSDPSTSDPASKPDGDNDNPNSGLALAVFPAIVAGAAVVVAKKRK